MLEIILAILLAVTLYISHRTKQNLKAKITVLENELKSVSESLKEKRLHLERQIATNNKIVKEISNYEYMREVYEVAILNKVSYAKAHKMIVDAKNKAEQIKFEERKKQEKAAAEVERKYKESKRKKSSNTGYNSSTSTSSSDSSYSALINDWTSSSSSSSSGSSSSSSDYSGGGGSFSGGGSGGDW